MDIGQIAATVYTLGFFGVIGSQAVRVGRRIGYSPITIFSSGTPLEIARVLLVWSYPPMTMVAAWHADVAVFEPISSIARVEIYGLVLLGMGLLLFPVACVNLGDSWRIGLDPRRSVELVTSGIYRWIRHPIYTAFTLMYFGVFLALPTALTALGAVLGITVFTRRAFLEERFLVGQFGDRYRAYMKDTGRLFPRLWMSLNDR